MVGIISHVSELKQRIPLILEVTSNQYQSHTRFKVELKMAKLIQYCHTVLKYDYLALNKSRISVNKTVFSSISSSGSSFLH